MRAESTVAARQEHHGNQLWPVLRRGWEREGVSVEVGGEDPPAGDRARVRVPLRDPAKISTVVNECRFWNFDKPIVRVSPPRHPLSCQHEPEA